MLSIIVPVLNEAKIIQRQLEDLQVYREQGAELIVVDGGSEDQTAHLAKFLADRVIVSEPGRATQMNRGAEIATGKVLLFLHIDTDLPDNSFVELQQILLSNHFNWGWFDVRLSNAGIAYQVVASCMNIRARLTWICTGDQSLLVSRQLFRKIRGFPEIPLMEDVAISKLLRRVAQPWICKEPVVASVRRWEQKGLVRTVLLMWKLRLLYFAGVNPDRLVTRYY
jgi:rSAM/selenodomain-associated transferase 2